MTREEALQLAQAEIDCIKDHNEYLSGWTGKLYHSVPQDIGSDEPFILELFADYILLRNSPLMLALDESSD